MLLFAATMDYRVNNEVATVEAWAFVLDSDIDRGWASEWVRGHYANSTEPLLAANLNRAWRAHRAQTRGAEVARVEAHCGNTRCRCDHSRCFKGWVEEEDHVARRCETCRGSLPVHAGNLEIMR